MRLDPPPPANQIIYVENAEPVEIRDTFDPVRVTGTLASSTPTSELAEVGYRITADEVTPTVRDRPRFLFERQR